MFTCGDTFNWNRCMTCTKWWINHMIHNTVITIDIEMEVYCLVSAAIAFVFMLLAEQKLDNTALILCLVPAVLHSDLTQCRSCGSQEKEVGCKEKKNIWYIFKIKKKSMLRADHFSLYQPQCAGRCNEVFYFENLPDVLFSICTCPTWSVLC